MSFLAPATTHAGRTLRQRAIATAALELPPADLAKSRIRQVFGSALDSEHHDGAHWYPTARRIAEQVADAAGRRGDTELGAGLIASLSPQCSWDENIIRAFAAAEGDETLSVTADCAWKAHAIVSGVDPSAVLGGRKVRSFYRNILGDENAVTVDRHAVAIVFGRALSDREIKLLERPGTYLWIAAAYRSVARELGIPASTLQAITWLAWRRLKGTDYDATESF